MRSAVFVCGNSPWSSPRSTVQGLYTTVQQDLFKLVLHLHLWTGSLYQESLLQALWNMKRAEKCAVAWMLHAVQRFILMII